MEAVDFLTVLPSVKRLPGDPPNMSMLSEFLTGNPWNRDLQMYAKCFRHGYFTNITITKGLMIQKG